MSYEFLSVGCVLFVGLFYYLITETRKGDAEDTPAKPLTTMVLRLAHTGDVPAEEGFNASIITPSEVGVASVEQQATFPGDVALTIGAAKQVSFPDLADYLQRAYSHPNIKWVYLYDELGWEDGQFDFKKYKELIAPAGQIQAAGLKVAVTILPEVVLDSAFELDFTAFDVIALDVYPSLGIDWNAGSHLSDNKVINALCNSIAKLRAMGFTGDIWYVYQAFGNHADPDLVANMKLQKEALAVAPSLGVTGLVAFGLYDETHTNLPDPLYQGKGSDIEQYLK